MEGKKLKLSEVQQEVIKKLRAGEVVHYISGIDARCFLNNKNLKWATIHRLEALKLVERKHNRYIGLTELGKTIEL